jgi:hypothetical protein
LYLGIGQVLRYEADDEVHDEEAKVLVQLIDVRLVFEESGELLQTRDHHLKDAELAQRVLVHGVGLEQLEQEVGAQDVPLRAVVVLDGEADVDELLARHKAELEGYELERRDHLELHVGAFQVHAHARLVQAVKEHVVQLEYEVVARLLVVDVLHGVEHEVAQLVRLRLVEDVEERLDGADVAYRASLAAFEIL